MKKYVHALSDRLFHHLKTDEELAVSLHSEESEFVRFNHSLVRQNTHVNQHEVTLVYSCNSRTYKFTRLLTLNLELDTAELLSTLTQLRSQLSLLDPSPKYSPLENHGTSEVLKKSIYPSASEVLQEIAEDFSDCDMAGLLTMGPVRQAALNSKGQFHYFENDQFFFDYSVYDGPRAAKGYYSEHEWNRGEFDAQARTVKNTLALLKRPLVKVKPGQHRTYLAPMAVSEIATIFNWRALSRAAYEQGFSPFKKLVTGEKSLSSQFSLIENNQLGLNSHFNSLGELSPQYLPIIESGRMKNMLVSSATAKEYGIESNFADSGLWNNEAMRSMEIRAGTLDENEVLSRLGTGLFLTNLHYINWSDPSSARITGMTRFACFWVENGEIVGPIQDLRFDDSLFNIFGDQLVALTQHRSTFVNTSTYQKRSLGGMIVPGILLEKMNFTL